MNTPSKDMMQEAIRLSRRTSDIIRNTRIAPRYARGTVDGEEACVFTGVNWGQRIFLSRPFYRRFVLDIWVNGKKQVETVGTGDEVDNIFDSLVERYLLVESSF